MRWYKAAFYIILSIFLFSSHVNASQCFENNSRNLFVSLQNLGSEHCQMVESTISRGKLIHSNIPRILEATGERFEFILTGHTVALTLNYNCGVQKKFTIYMKQYFKKGHRHTSIDASMLDAVDVFETHAVIPGIHICDSDGSGGISCYARAGKINWSITH